MQCNSTLFNSTLCYLVRSEAMQKIITRHVDPRLRLKLLIHLFDFFVDVVVQRLSWTVIMYSINNNKDFRGGPVFLTKLNRHH